MGAATPKKEVVDFTKLNFARLAHSYCQETKKDLPLDDLNHLIKFVDYACRPDNQKLPTYKVGVMFVCINPPYWSYASQVIQGIRAFFLPGHQTEIMMWADLGTFPESKDVTYGADKVFHTESIQWPYPTLMRYHLFLQQEEYLKQFDYLFYLDLDMRLVNTVGDEILPREGLMAAQHPMYALDRKFVPPYEPNETSASFIPRPGRVIDDNGRPRFEPLYFAGGFQGGKTEPFVKAMKGAMDLIEQDLKQSYIPIWNDESAWNRYLFDNPPEVVLNPSYVYPDSMIEPYYKKIWGRDYLPRIITITKPFTMSKEGGAAAANLVGGLQGL